MPIVDRPHPHHFSSAEIINMLEDIGFEVEQKRIRKSPRISDNLKNKIELNMFRMTKIWCVCNLK